jgi:hypothetical protein
MPKLASQSGPGNGHRFCLSGIEWLPERQQSDHATTTYTTEFITAEFLQ